jgi:hypothetical protein
VSPLPAVTDSITPTSAGALDQDRTPDPLIVVVSYSDTSAIASELELRLLELLNFTLSALQIVVEEKSSS